MKFGFLAGLVLLLLSMPPRVAAQETPTAAASGAVIGPEDGVSIVALNADDISKTWRVSSTGELTLPMVGKIHAAGKTTEELEAELTSKLSHYIRRCVVACRRATSYVLLGSRISCRAANRLGKTLALRRSQYHSTSETNCSIVIAYEGRTERTGS